MQCLPVCLYAESAADREIWSKCACPEFPGVCVDALNSIQYDPAASNCSQRQAALDCALMPYRVGYSDGSPNGALCNGRYTPYGHSHPGATCRDIATSYSDRTCVLSYRPNADRVTTSDPDMDNLPALRELLTKCNHCEADGFYCSYAMEYFRGLRKKNLILDHCVDIQRVFGCGFVPTPKEGPRGFLGKQGTCGALRSMYSFEGCPMTCNPTTTTPPCKGSCLAGTCDGFVRSYGVTCNALEANGCDCSGCTRCTDASPKNYAIKVGFEC